MGQSNTREAPRSKVFGRSLIELDAHYREIFPPVRVCLEHLAQEAVLAEANLFFRPRSELELAELVKYFEAELDRPDVLTLARFSPHTVAGFLKKFFELLPEPLLTFDRYEQFTGAMDKLEDVYHACSLQADFYDRLFFIQSLVVTLPRAHYMTLERTLRVLAALSDPQVPNHVHASRLGVIFGDCFLRPRPLVVHTDSGQKKSAASAKDDKVAPAAVGQGAAPQAAGGGAAGGHAPGGPQGVGAAEVKGAAADGRAFGLSGAAAKPLPDGYWHVDRKVANERVQHLVTFLIENYAEIFGVNPVRELKLMAKHYKSMKQVYTAREEQLSKIEEKNLKVKIVAAERTFLIKIARRHFSAWHMIAIRNKCKTANDTVHVLRSQLSSQALSLSGKENRYADADAESVSSSEFTEQVKRGLSTHGTGLGQY